MAHDFILLQPAERNGFDKLGLSGIGAVPGIIKGVDKGV
jgi:hypothetical protein